MKKSLFLAFILLGLNACTSSNEKTQSEDTELVKRYIAAVEKLDYEAMDALLHENYLGFGPSYGDTTRRQDAIANWRYNAENTYEKITYNRQHFTAVVVPEGPDKGEWVAHWADLTIDFKDGKSVTIWANTNYQIESGKIKTSYTFYNEADVQRQLGYMIMPATVE